MTIKPLIKPGNTPGVEFQRSLEKIRTGIASRGEVPQVRNLISDDSIRELNRIAISQYDSDACAVRFYGGMIHRHPEAEFEIKDGKSGKVRSTCRELADMLIVVVFSEPTAAGTHIRKRSRACLIQAKTSGAMTGPKVLNLVPLTEDTPKKTNHEQFYLLNRWPPFVLKNEVPPRSYDLATLDTIDKPLGKYCFLWSKKGGATRPRTWCSSWQCSAPLPNLAANLPLGDLLADLVDSAAEVGRDFELAPTDDWDNLINELTSHCRVNTWNKESKLADPGGVSFMDGIAAYGTIMQYAPAVLDFPNVPYSLQQLHDDLYEFFPPSVPDDNPEGMPVLIVSVSTFFTEEDRRELPLEAKRDLFRDALDTLIRIP